MGVEVGVHVPTAPHLLSAFGSGRRRDGVGIAAALTALIPIRDRVSAGMKIAVEGGRESSPSLSIPGTTLRVTADTEIRGGSPGDAGVGTVTPYALFGAGWNFNRGGQNEFGISITPIGPALERDGNLAFEVALGLESRLNRLLSATTQAGWIRNAGHYRIRHYGGSATGGDFDLSVVSLVVGTRFHLSPAGAAW